MTSRVDSQLPSQHSPLPSDPLPDPAYWSAGSTFRSFCGMRELRSRQRITSQFLLCPVARDPVLPHVHTNTMTHRERDWLSFVYAINTAPIKFAGAWIVLLVLGNDAESQARVSAVGFRSCAAA